MSARQLTGLRNERCLVTGGAGAIGSNLTRALVAHGCEVTVLDNLSSGHLSNLDDVSDRVEFVLGDVNCESDLDLAFSSSPELVFHLAAHFANQNSIDHPLSDCLTNANGTLRLLEKSRSVRGLKRFVYASSSCVLGHCDGIMYEETPVNPDTPYGISKLSGELYTLLFSRVFELPATVVRYFNVYGPGERPGRYRNVLPNFVQRALDGLPLVVTGSGEESREFVYVDDAVHGTVLAATLDAGRGELFHIGSGHVRTINDLAKSVIAATDSKSLVDFAPRRSWDHVLFRQTSFEKANKMLGYAPTTSFEHGLEKTVVWIRSLRSSDLALDPARS